MRRRLALLVTAMTTAVVFAFVVPLAFMLWSLAEGRIVSTATAQNLATLNRALAANDPLIGASNSREYLNENTVTGITTTLTVFRGSSVIAGPEVTDPAAISARDSSTVGVLHGHDTAQGRVLLSVERRSPDLFYISRTVISADALHRDVTNSIIIVSVLGVVLIIVAVFTADILARRVSKPIQLAAAAADALREGDLEVRVAERGPREVVALARAVNRLAERIGRLLSSERDAVADLSHRLRTPVTALRLDTEMVTDPELGDRLRGHVAQLERTVDAIVHDARRPARTDAQGGFCDVSRVVRDRVAYWSALAEEQGRPLRTAVPDRPLRARVDAAELSDVVDVLLDNVFAHTPDGVPMEVWVAPRADGAIVLTVEDGGPGLPQGDIVSRGSSGAGSTGLGLDIARRASLASGGWLELGQSRLGGALIRVVLGGHIN